MIPSRLPSIEKLVKLDPEFNYDYQSNASRRHLGYRRAMESPGMSGALGGLGYQRYGNLQQRNERGPCPQGLIKTPSIPIIITDVDRKSQQYQQDL
jgi:hypothetical protein